MVLRGIGRVRAQPQRRVAPLIDEELFAICNGLRGSVREIRDQALLLVGFAGAFRRSELVALDASEWNRRRCHLHPQGSMVRRLRAFGRAHLSAIDQGGHGDDGTALHRSSGIDHQTTRQIAGTRSFALFGPFSSGWLRRQRDTGRASNLAHQRQAFACRFPFVRQQQFIELISPGDNLRRARRISRCYLRTIFRLLPQSDSCCQWKPNR
jgi:integrase